MPRDNDRPSSRRWASRLAFTALLALPARGTPELRTLQASRDVPGNSAQGDSEPTASSDSARLGGPATVWRDGPHAFSLPAPVLDAAERRRFAVGNAFFKDNWVTAPASAEGRDGLGPLFNARSCSGCHLRDGRGRPPRPGEQGPTGLLLRLGVDSGSDAADLPHPTYGVQLQDDAIPGVRPEGRLDLTTVPRAGSFADGEAFILEVPTYGVREASFGPLGDGLRVGPRVAPQMIGLGLLEAIPEADIVAAADPRDMDGDGISGRPHFVPNARRGAPSLGRFGWKATQPTVEQQVAAAFVNDVGITSELARAEALTETQAAQVDAPSGGDPELSAHKLERVTFYSSVLGVPAQRGQGEARVRRGRDLFDGFGCADCHTPTWTTGEAAVIPEFAGQVIWPYTDLLLHDMGAELADGKRDGSASGREWRTPPLWGVGLFEAVNGHTRYLHDGRARDLNEAVLWHGGEAEQARERYLRAAKEDREALLAFLGSL